MFETLSPSTPDALMKVIQLYKRDGRHKKIDLGIGTYRDDSGGTPIFSAVKKAEFYLQSTQTTKAYVGPEGDQDFIALLAPIVLPTLLPDDRWKAIQTPGGTGAVRLGAELIRLAKPGAKVFVGIPTWPNHEPIMEKVGLQVVRYRYFDPALQAVCFDEMLSALSTGGPGDVVLLHGCCHNPTGADLSLDQWKIVAEVVNRRGLVPFIDLAYQGMGHGLGEDVRGVHQVLAQAREAIIAQSCSKNFGLYRERTGALFLIAESSSAAGLAYGRLTSLARLGYSMPPDHGASVVRTILENDELRAEWFAELIVMRTRVVRMRAKLASLGSSAGLETRALTKGLGMFGMLPITPGEVEQLRDQHAVYMADNGRINIAGLRSFEDAECFVEAVAAVLRLSA